MPEAVLAPGARIECRSPEWLVRSLGTREPCDEKPTQINQLCRLIDHPQNNEGAA